MGLEPLISDDLPAGYDSAPDAAEDTGPIDLFQAAFFVGTPDEAGVLSELEFRRGYQRLWYGPNGGDDLIVHLYEFCGRQGAAAYVRHTRDRLVSPSWGSVEIKVEGLPDGDVGLLQKAEPDDESFLAILRSHGPYYIEIGAYAALSQENLSALAARAYELSEAQVASLP